MRTDWTRWVHFLPKSFGARNENRKETGNVLIFAQFRLTSFVTLSAHAGYCVAGYPFVFSDFALLSAGTFLCSCSANVWNQLQEFPFDSQMDRTKSRPFIKKEISNLTGKITYLQIEKYFAFQRIRYVVVFLPQDTVQSEFGNGCHPWSINRNHYEFIVSICCFNLINFKALEY